MRQVDNNELNLGPYILALSIVVSLFLSTISFSYFHIEEIEAAQAGAKEVVLENTGSARQVYFYREVNEGAYCSNPSIEDGGAGHQKKGNGV